MPEPQSLISLSKEILTYLVHSFGEGTLTTTGVQYGASGVATSTDVWKVVETKTIQPFTEYFGSRGNLIEVEFGLTTATVRSSTGGAAGTVTYRYQVKNLNEATATDDWVELIGATGHSTAVGSTEAESTYSGRMTIASKFTKVPFQIRLLVMAGSVGGSTGGDSSTGAYARAKSSSYVKVLYRVE